jgi:hypothetical protein
MFFSRLRLWFFEERSRDTQTRILHTAIDSHFQYIYYYLIMLLVYIVAHRLCFDICRDLFTVVWCGR